MNERTIQQRGLGLLIVCLLALSSPSANAQVAFGSMVGNITDATGGGIAGATVKITLIQTNESRTVVTNETGGYDVPLLPPGRYTIAGHKQGFKQAMRDGLELELNQIAQIDFTMVAGEVSAVQARNLADHLLGREPA